MARLLSVAIVSSRYWTRMSRTTPCRYATKPKTVATVSASNVVTETTGANCLADVTGARLLTRTITEKTKVARNNPSVTRVTRERMKTRTVLGEYWLAASWIATSVVANTTATNAKVAAAIAPAKVAAVPGSLTRSGRTPIGASTRASSQMVRSAATIAAAAKMAGRNHSDTAIRWRKSVRHSGSGRTGSALMIESLSARHRPRPPRGSLRSVHDLADVASGGGAGRGRAGGRAAGRDRRP